MKRIFHIFTLLCILPVATYAQHATFQKYASLTDVKYVNISHTMLVSMSSQKNVMLGNMKLSDMIDYIDNVLIISSHTPTGMATILNDYSLLQSTPGYEPLLTKNIHGHRSTSLFYTGNGHNEFVLFSFADTYTIIVITGHFTPKQFQSFFL